MTFKAVGDGLCKCGCGQITKISRYQDLRWGYAKGQHRDYINGHANKLPYAFTLQDRGYTSPCWIWNRHVHRGGYGLLSSWYKNVKSRYAHRYYYELLIGPIPEGLDLDHLCRVRCCVNPNHLEPVTPSVNSRRGKNTKLTQDHINEILELRKNRVKAKDIAAQFGIHESYVEILCGRNKVWTTVRLTKEQKQEMLDLRRKGMHLKDLAARYGIHHKCAGTICRRGGVYTHARPIRNNVVDHPH